MHFGAEFLIGYKTHLVNKEWGWGDCTPFWIRHCHRLSIINTNKQYSQTVVHLSNPLTRWFEQRCYYWSTQPNYACDLFVERYDGV